MVRRRQRKTDIPSHRARQYQRVANGLQESAEALHALADEGDRYGNAIGVLAVHAAIAWTDAITISYGGVKHTGADHAEAADLLLEVVPESRMSADARKKLRAFSDWAREVYERRPA